MKFYILLKEQMHQEFVNDQLSNYLETDDRVLFLHPKVYHDIPYDKKSLFISEESYFGKKQQKKIKKNFFNVLFLNFDEQEDKLKKDLEYFVKVSKFFYFYRNIENIYLFFLFFGGFINLFFLFYWFDKILYITAFILTVIELHFIRKIKKQVYKKDESKQKKQSY